MIWIALWLVACAVIVLALAIRANEREIADIRRALAEKEDDLK